MNINFSYVNNHTYNQDGNKASGVLLQVGYQDRGMMRALIERIISDLHETAKVAMRSVKLEVTDESRRHFFFVDALGGVPVFLSVLEALSCHGWAVDQDVQEEFFQDLMAHGALNVALADEWRSRLQPMVPLERLMAEADDEQSFEKTMDVAARLASTRSEDALHWYLKAHQLAVLYRHEGLDLASSAALKELLTQIDSIHIDGLTQPLAAPILRMVNTCSHIATLCLRDRARDDIESVLTPTFVDFLKSSKHIAKVDLVGETRRPNVAAVLVKSLSDVLRINTKIDTLKLNGRCIGDGGLIQLVAAMRENPKCGLVHLWLDGCGVTAKGVKALLDYVKGAPKLPLLFVALGKDIECEAHQQLKDILLSRCFSIRSPAMWQPASAGKKGSHKLSVESENISADAAISTNTLS